RPRMDVRLGLDSEGFYLQPTTTVGASIQGAVTGSGTFAPLGVKLGGQLAFHPELVLHDTDTDHDGRIRTAEFLSRLDQIRLRLVDGIQAELTTDLILSELDFVDVEPWR